MPFTSGVLGELILVLAPLGAVGLQVRFEPGPKFLAKGFFFRRV
jgi:hypothetical protein